MKKDAEEYISAVQKELLNKGFHVYTPSLREANSPDLVVGTTDGKLIGIEVKDAKTYGKLPLSTALELKNIKENYPALFLISLSDISKTLSESLNIMGVKYMVRPTVKDAVITIANASYSMSA